MFRVIIENILRMQNSIDHLFSIILKKNERITIIKGNTRTHIWKERMKSD